MKHTSKRLLALLLSVLMIITLLPVGAFAEPAVPEGAVAYVTDASGAPVVVEGVDSLGVGYYKTLQAAFDAAPTDGSTTMVKVLADITTLTKLVVNGGRNVTIDFGGTDADHPGHSLNGQIKIDGATTDVTVTGYGSISMNVSGEKNYPLYLYDGYLTVENGTFTVGDNAKADSAVVYAYGSASAPLHLTIKGGTFINNSKQTSTQYALRNEYSIVNVSNATFECKLSGTVNAYAVYCKGGTTKLDSVTASAPNGNSGYAVYATTNADLEIDGGTYTGRAGAVIGWSGDTIKIKDGSFVLNGQTSSNKFWGSVIAYNSSKITIDGGIFTSYITDKPAVWVNDSASALTINGGTFTGNGSSEAITLAGGATPTINVSGGKFSSQLNNEWLPLGKKASGKGEDGSFTLEDAGETEGVICIRKNGMGSDAYAFSMKAAITFLEDGDTIQLLDNVSGNAVIPEGINTTLDLNGFTLSGQLTNKGNLTITGNGKIERIAEVKYGTKNGKPSLTAIENTGTLTVKNGTIMGKNTRTSQCAASAINNTGGTVLIEGGTLSAGCPVATGSLANYPSAAVYSAGGTVTIKGGSLTATMNVTKGTADTAVWLDSKAKANISGGTFEGASKELNIASGTSCSITGGSFKHSSGIEAKVATGYALSSAVNESGYYTVSALDPSEAAVLLSQPGGAMLYTNSLSTAFANAENGATIKLLKDLSSGADLSKKDIDITLDMNGKTITGQVVVRAGSTLTITGNGTINYSDGYAVGTANSTNAKLIIENGTITGTDDGIRANSGTITLLGGTVRGDVNGASTNDSGSSEAKLVIIGGSVTGGTEDVAIRSQKTEGCIQISGGSFSKPVNPDFCAEGYIPNSNAIGGRYEVKLGTATEDDCPAVLTYKEGGETKTAYYLSVGSAITAAGGKTDAVVTVRKNTSAASLAPAGKCKLVVNEGVTLNCDNVTFSSDSASGVVLENNGTIKCAGAFTGTVGSGTFVNNGIMECGSVSVGTSGCVNNGAIKGNADKAKLAASKSITGTNGFEEGSYAWDATNEEFVISGAVEIFRDGVKVKAFDALSVAMEAAQNGDLIKLNGDITGTAVCRKTLTLNLNGYNISAATDEYTKGVITVESGADLTVMDSKAIVDAVANEYGNVTDYSAGMISNASGYAASTVLVKSGAKFTLDSGMIKSSSNSSNTFAIAIADNTLIDSTSVCDRAVVTINGGAVVNTTGRAILIMGHVYSPVNSEGLGEYADTDTTLNIKGGVVSGYSSAITGQGNYNNTKINISGGEVVSRFDLAIYQPQYGITDVTGGTIKGSNGVSVKGGILNVYEGAEIIANGDRSAPPIEQFSGTYKPGDALYLEDNYNRNAQINIFGGKITSVNGSAVSSCASKNDTKAAINVSGGHFMSGTDVESVYTHKNAKYKEIALLKGGFYSEKPKEDYIADGYRCFTLPAGDAEYANGYRYVVVPTVAITYDANGGEGSMTAGAAPKGYAFTLAENEFTRDYHHFVGWAKTNDATKEDCITNDTFTKATTLYAVWELNDAIITFEKTDGSGTMDPQTVKMTIPTALTHCTFAAPMYKEFIGWALSINGTKEYDDGADITITANTTLYALWGLKDAKISFNANGGSGKMDDQSVTMTVAAKLTSNTFTRNGYTFIGWAETSNGEVKYKNTDSITVTADTTTLYAVWKENVVIPTNPTDPEPKPVVPGVDTIVEPGAGENKQIKESQAESIVNGETDADQAKQIVEALNKTMVIGDESLVKVAEEKAAQVIAAAETTDNKPINAEVAREKLSAKVPDVATKDITIVVEPYFESEIKGYNLEPSGNWVIDVDLEAVCAIKATTDPANMTDANTVLLSKESVDLNTLGDNINVKIELKEAVKITEKAVIVMHTHGGKTFFYNGTVSENGTVVTFVNPDDFSNFKIMKEIPKEYVARVGDQYFKSLKDAIDNANGKTVYLVQNSNEKITLSKEITFTLITENGARFTGSINAGNGYYKAVSGNTYKIGFYKCTGTQEVAIGNGSFEMYVNGHSIGQVRLEKTGNGWKIIKSNGKAISSDLGDVWKYENGCFVQTSTQRISRGFMLWNILFGRKSVTTTNYITFTDALHTSGGAESYAKVKLMQPFTNAEHNYQWVSNGNGTHSKACVCCGDKTGVTETCDYANGACKYCGASDPRTTGYINVNVNTRKTGLLFFKLYIADIKVSSDIVHIKKVEYSVGTSGLKYTTGNKVMSTSPINELVIVVTASDGAHRYRYNAATGVVTPYDFM